MNRSYSKLRNAQQVNLLSEQRYLVSKGLLKEEPIDDITTCFSNAGLDVNKFTSCVPSKVADQQVNIQACINQIQEKASDPTIGLKVTQVITCLSSKMPDLFKMGTDILKTGSDIFTGIFGGKK
jgi:hypothetical protein